jgi:glutaredoxin
MDRVRIPGLTLYYHPSCYYCRTVFRALDELGIEVERRDIHQNPEALIELIEARSRRTVPVLRIEDPDGRIWWMPESQDIIAFLRARYAH